MALGDAPAPMEPLPIPHPKVALVLGSGGLNCLAAIPLIEFLEQHRIRPGLLVGCSGGSIPLAVWACGHRGQDMEVIWKRVNAGIFIRDWRSIASMLGVGWGFTKDLCIFKPGPVFKALETLFGGRRLEDLDPPLVLQSTDFETGEGVELESGDLVQTVYASCAAYPFLHPIRLHGRWLFDGVFSSPVPILPAVRRGVDIILAMDFMEKLRPEPKNLFEAMRHLDNVIGRSIYQSQTLASIDLHRHEILQMKVRFNEVGVTQMWDTTAFERIQAAGRQAVAEYGSEILLLIDSFKGPQADRLQPGSPPNGAGHDSPFNRGQSR